MTTGVRTDAGYDALGRQISATNPRTGVSTTHYNSLGQVDWVADALTNITRFSYCPTTGRRTAVTDALSNTTYTAYDPEGRVIATWGATYPVAYEYDPYGRMTAMATTRESTNDFAALAAQLAAGASIMSIGSTGSLDITQWLYDLPTGLLTNKLYSDGKGPSYTYTPQGQLATRTWARGVTTTYAYATDGAMTNIIYSDGTPAVSFTLDRLGRQVAITDATGSRAFAYNDALQLAAETNAFGVLVRAYDGLGRSAGFSLFNPANPVNPVHSITYGYDSLGRFHSVSSSVFSALSVAQYSYLPDSDLISGWSNGILQTVRSFEPNRDLLTGVQNLANGTAISTYAYFNDVLGRRIQRIDTTASAMTNAFVYNTRSELTNAVMGAQNFAWAFDSIGNRQTSTANGTNRTYLANALNQYTNISNGDTCEPTYDLDGNTLTYKGWALSWDGENRLQGASNGSTIVSFQYDHMGRRFSKIVNGVTNLFYYDGWSVIAEKSAGATTCHIWGPDLSGSIQGAGGIGGLLATYASGNLYFACADGNGNVTAYTDATGTNVVARYRYGAYGELLEVSGVKASDFHILFSSKYLDRETAVPECPGWYYYGYRYLWDGRWTSRDPIGEKAGLLLYNMCGNNCIGFVDALGLATIRWPPPGGIGLPVVPPIDILLPEDDLDPGAGLYLPPPPSLALPPLPVGPPPPHPQAASLKASLVAKLKARCPALTAVADFSGVKTCCPRAKCLAQADALAQAIIDKVEYVWGWEKLRWGNVPANGTYNNIFRASYSPGDGQVSTDASYGNGLKCTGWHEIISHAYNASIPPYAPELCFDIGARLDWISDYIGGWVFQHIWTELIGPDGGKVEIDPWKTAGNNIYR